MNDPTGMRSYYTGRFHFAQLNGLRSQVGGVGCSPDRLGPYHRVLTAPPSFSRSAWIHSDQPIVAVANQETSSDHQSYSGFIGGARTIYLPLVQQNYNGWVTGIQVQNTGEVTATVTINFYHASGASAGYTGPWEIAPRAFKVFYTEIPDGLNGSAVVTADQDVVAIVNQNNYGISDGALSYSGLD